METVPRTMLGTGQPFPENRPVIEVGKPAGINGEGPQARVVEEKQTLDQGFKVGLISDDMNTRITQKFFPGFPFSFADGADLERNAFYGRFFTHGNLLNVCFVSLVFRPYEFILCRKAFNQENWPLMRKRF